MPSTGMLAGRLALVTGGGSGIGRSICSVLAREGALVAVADMNKSSAEETVSLLPKYTPAAGAFEGCSHSAFANNVASLSDVASMVENIQKTFNAPPSAAVHAAGIAKDAYLVDLDENTWDLNIAVNLKGTYIVNQALAKAMIAANIPNGSIVNIASIIAKTGNLGQPAYAAAKAGVVGFTKSAAKELAKNNIRVNSLLPGFVATPMAANLPEEITRIVPLIPLQRMAQPEEIAEVCAFLTSDKSSYVTGSAIEATGGLFI